MPNFLQVWSKLSYKISENSWRGFFGTQKVSKLSPCYHNLTMKFHKNPLPRKLIIIHMKDRNWPVGEERLRKLWLWWRLWCNLRARPVSSLADNDVPEFFGDRMFPVVAETEIALVLEHPAEDADFLRVVFRTDSSKSKIRIRFFSSGCHSIQSL